MDVLLGPEPLLPEAPFTVHLCIIGAHDKRQVMILQTDLTQDTRGPGERSLVYL